MRYLVLLSLFCVWFCFSNADIAFTWPVPGALLGSGDVTLWWKEDGDALLISEMGSHLLVLYTGNNNVMTTLNEWAIPIGSYNITIQLDASLGPNATNSYFFGIQSNPINSSSYPSTAIPVLTNYSPRFSLTNMTGADFTPSIVAANAVCDTTDGPDSVIRMESDDQVAFNMHAVSSLSSAQLTTSGAIGNPTHGAAVTNIPLTPSASSRATISSSISSTSTSTSISTVPSSTTTPIPATISPQTPTPTPFTQDSHKRIVIAVPLSIGVALLIGLLIFFYIRNRRQKQSRPPIKGKPSTTSSSSILPFFPPPPTHPNTWVDNSALTLKGKSNRFWSRLKAKRPRRSVAELPGYENPSIRNPTPDSIPKFSTNANTDRITSTSSHTPLVISSVLPHPPPPSAVQLPAHPTREVGFAATGPAPTSVFSSNPSPHPYPPKHHQHLTVNTSQAPAPRPKSQTYPSDEKTIKTTTTGVSAIPSSTALSFDPMPPPPFDYISSMVQGGGTAAGMNSQQSSFRSPMARRDETAAMREAELRIRGLLGGGSGSGVVSPASSVSR